MELENLCMGCMEDKISAEEECFHCGYVEGASPESPLFLTPRTVLEGKYLIGRVLGQGGFGITYLAWDQNLNIKVAIKEYFPQDLASRAAGHSQVSAYTGTKSGQYEYGMDKFLQEARTLAQFEGHPNIVSVRDFFKSNGTAYFVMNFIEGLTVKDYLESMGGKLPVDQAEGIIMPVLDALKEVHAVNVLHRDISPDNIFITKKGQVILVDFGAARQAISEKGHSLSIILKPGYAPEEQYRSKGNQGPWTDIYAVAATMYHLVTGWRPPEALERLVDDKLVVPSQLGVDLTQHQEAALMKAMTVRATDRFQTVQEFQDALLGKEPAGAAEAPTPEPAPPPPPTPPPPPPGTEQRTDSVAETQARPAGEAPPGPVGETQALPAQEPPGEDVQQTVAVPRDQMASQAQPHYPPPQADFRQPQPVKRKSSPVGLIIGLAAVVLIGIGGIALWLGGVFDDDDATVDDPAVVDDPADDVVNVIGNSGGNIANGGLAAVQGNHVYFRSNEGSSLFRGNFVTGESRIISADAAWFINVSGDWIYFSNSDDRNRAYKIKTDGSERTALTDSPAWYLTLVDQQLYYVNGNDGYRIYRINTDGSGNTALNEDESWAINVADGWIYYVNRSEDDQIYRLRTDGGGRMQVTDHAACCVNVTNGWLYYVHEEDGSKLYRSRADGSEQNALTEYPVWFVNVAEDWIYFVHEEDNFSLHKIKPDGTGRTMLTRESSRYVNVAGDWVFHVDQAREDTIYRVRSDGTGRTLAESEF